MADKPAVMPTAVVAEVYQSRYTIEWVNGPMPLGTNLYAGPKVVKAWAEEVPEDSACDASVTVTYVHARGDVTRMSKYQALIDSAPWYSVDKSGAATLCTGQDDAIATATDSQTLYPRNGPYEATQLVPVDKLRALLADLERAEKALKAVAAWGPFPRVPDPLSNEPGATISYGLAYGSNGERDYIRGIAQVALAQMAGG